MPIDVSEKCHSGVTQYHTSVTGINWNEIQHMPASQWELYHSVPQCATVYHGVPQCTTVYSTQWTPFDWAASYIPSSEHQYATPSHRRVIVFTCCVPSLVSLNLFLASVTLPWSEVWYGLRYGLKYERRVMRRGMSREVWGMRIGMVRSRLRGEFVLVRSILTRTDWVHTSHWLNAPSQIE